MDPQATMRFQIAAALLLFFFVSVGNAQSSRNLLRVEPRVAEGQDSFGGHDFFTLLLLRTRSGVVDGYCGASLIWPDVILTAAHCLDYSSLQEVIAIVNATVFDIEQVFESSRAPDILTPTGGERIRVSSSFQFSPNYESDYVAGLSSHDVALIHLAEPVLDVTPIPFNTNPNFPPATSQATFVGMGLTSIERELYPNVTQTIDLKIHRKTVCDRFLDSKDLAPFAETPLLCTLAEDIGGGVLSGDSGSALFLNGVQVGLYSFGPATDVITGLYPNYYSEVSAYADFIQEFLCNESSMPPSDCASSGSNSVSTKKRQRGGRKQNPQNNPIRNKGGRKRRPPQRGSGDSPDGSPLPPVDPSRGRPDNDACSNAFPVAVGFIVDGTTVNATQDDDLDMSCTNEPALGVWYSFQAFGRVVVSTCAGADFDTSIAVFTGDCDTGLTCLLSNDDSCGLQSQVVLDAEEGVEYKVFVEGFGSSTGQFQLEVTAAPPPPPNDQCSDAILVNIGDVVDGTNVGATVDDQVGSCRLGLANGVWYKFVGTGDDVILSTCAGADFDTAIAVFTGNCETGLTCLGTNDDFCGRQSRVDLGTQDGTLYYVFVEGRGQASGEFTLQVIERDEPLPPPPLNDECLDAITLTVGDVVNGTNMDATVDDVGPCSSEPAVGVWYKFEGVLGMNVIVSTCAYSTFRTAMAVFTGGCGTGLDCLDHTDSECRLQISTEEGVLYYVFIEGFFNRQGDFTLELIGAPPPPNDECSDATMLQIGDVVGGSGYGADLDSEIPCFGDPTAGVWFSFVGDGSKVFVSTCWESTYETTVSVLTGDCDTGLTCVVVGDIFCSPGSAEYVDTEEGVLYYIFVEGFAEDPNDSFILEILDVEDARPSNDACSGAIQLEEGSVETGNAFFATYETIDDCTYEEESDQRGLWYSVQGTGRRFNASTCASGGGLLTFIDVYRGGCQRRNCVSVMDGNPCGDGSLQYWVSFETRRNTVYYIYVYGVLTSVGDYGDFGLEIQIS